MSSSPDTIIVGGGLAGACAALHLSRHERVLLLEAEHPAGRASGAAAGLVNPLMGRSPRVVWRFQEAFKALHETLDRADSLWLFRHGGVLRPALNGKQRERYRQAVDDHPDQATWLSPKEVQQHYPLVRATEGGVLVRIGGAINVPRMVEALLSAATRNGAEVQLGARLTEWKETPQGVRLEAEQYGFVKQHDAKRVLLAMGASYVHHPALSALPLQRIKGQTVRVSCSDLDTASVPFLSGSGYVVPERNTLLVGSTYEHEFEDTEPTSEQTQRILKKTARMLPALKDAQVTAESAGVRVKVPNSRYPMLDRLPGAERTWVFTALGSKGLLTAPLLAHDLHQYFEDPSAVPEEVRVQRDGSS